MAEGLLAPPGTGGCSRSSRLDRACGSDIARQRSCHTGRLVGGTAPFPDPSEALAVVPLGLRNVYAGGLEGRGEAALAGSICLPVERRCPGPKSHPRPPDRRSSLSRRL